MVKRKAILRVIGVAVVFAVVLGAIAYGTPYFRAGDCQELTIRYLQQHPVRGRGLDQKWVSAKPTDVWVRVTGPFTSEASYSVPNDLHAVIYMHECKSGLFSLSLGPRKRFFTM